MNGRTEHSINSLNDLRLGVTCLDPKLGATCPIFRGTVRIYPIYQLLTKYTIRVIRISMEILTCNYEC